MDGVDPHSLSGSNLRAYFARQLMQPEWLTDIPPDLVSSCIGGNSAPLALLWKDASCSRYLLDTDAAGVVPTYQQVVLVYQGPDSAGVATADEPPVVLGRLPQVFVQQMGSKLRAGRLLRFSIQEGGLMFNPKDGSPAGADLAYEGPANQRRGRADLMSKIVFQWQARRNPMTLLKLVTAASAAAGTLSTVSDDDVDLTDVTHTN
eukprot:gene10599-10756_t